MTRKPNPFEQDLNPPADTGRAQHPSDHPGRDYDMTSAEAEGRTRSSGANAPSEPRRPGTNERQAPRRQSDSRLEDSEPLIPGEILHGDGDVVINEGAQITTLRVANTSDRPIQIGSHYHFAEVNAALDFDRDAAWGKRLSVLSGGAMRFEPGAVEEVDLIPIRGRRIVAGLRGLCKGGLDDA